MILDKINYAYYFELWHSEQLNLFLKHFMHSYYNFVEIGAPSLVLYNKDEIMMSIHGFVISAISKFGHSGHNGHKTKISLDS